MQQADSPGVLPEVCLGAPALSQGGSSCLHTSCVLTSPSLLPTCKSRSRMQPTKRRATSSGSQKIKSKDMGGPLLQELLYKTILACADEGLLHHSPFLRRPEQFKDHSTFLRNIPHSVGYTGINAPSTHLSNIPAGSQQEQCSTSQEDALLCVSTACLPATHLCVLRGSAWEVSFQHPKKPQTQPLPAGNQKHHKLHLLHLGERAPAEEWLQPGHPAPWALMVMLHKGHTECDKLMGARTIRKLARQLHSQPWTFTSLLALPMAMCMHPLPFSHPSLQGERVCWRLTDLQLLNSLL